MQCFSAKHLDYLKHCIGYFARLHKQLETGPINLHSQVSFRRQPQAQMKQLRLIRVVYSIKDNAFYTRHVCDIEYVMMFERLNICSCPKGTHRPLLEMSQGFIKAIGIKQAIFQNRC